ncbi:pilus assembly protein [Fluoribacter dumoffii]|uniref:Type II secretion system protein H n=1 Tax=Fluoribacter dumoffii TaxID=463 RepID=A0A377GB82_9GAMM|nr:GspH/FimT family pseudopilin [Fluoribacter dumoffii]KTC89028.1 Tfp type 4 fimbrial pilin related signal peptide protein domain protein [Fluoribacter dumoffii NY 23]MCW8385764.1 pilus assembly protein [Fluoribacter dumoffii]MCW8418793.1 pilus assembly protein [Fluoribacter dumoffii]MCW8453363.1 pilus assembly protein [Fluoribacter dumoffii]MCW8459416.1 pilus assembly protein [Fluoribacter dumoffii]
MKIKGFTFLELLITMTLFIGLSTIGIASYTYFINKNEQQTLIDELRIAIQYAKIQAVIMGKPVSLMPLEGASDWSKGIVLCHLNKRTNQLERIYQWQWHHLRLSLSWEGTGSRNKLTFSNFPGQAISNGHFILVNKIYHTQTKLILNRLGRIRISNNLSLLR